MFASIVRSHKVRYPEMDVQDLYKLVHQAAMGPGHAVDDPAAARGYLERELGGMGDGPPEPLFDQISGDGTLVRVHLRPYLASGGDLDSLLDAFLRTTNEYHGSVGDLEKYWEAARQTGLWSLPAMDEFFADMKKMEFPAVHHSERYSELYRPAYRVALRNLIA